MSGRTVPIGRRIRGTPRQELLFLRDGSLPHPRTAGPSGRVRPSRLGPDRRQPLRRPGVRPAGRRLGRQAHNRGRAGPVRRRPHRAAGPDARGLRQPLPPVHLGQRPRPARTPAGPGLPAGTGPGPHPAHRRTRRAAFPAADGRPHRRDAGSVEKLLGMVRQRLGVRGDTTEFPPGGHRPQPGTGQAGSERGRPGRCRQRRPLPLSGTLSAATDAGSRPAERHHRAGPALPQAQPSPLLEVAGGDGENLPAVPRGRGQHRQDRGAVRLQPCRRPGLFLARRRGAPGPYSRKPPAAPVPGGRPPALRLRPPPGARAAARRVPAH